MPEATKKKATRKRAKPAPEPRGLTPKQLVSAQLPASLERLREQIGEDGGRGGRQPIASRWAAQWQLFAGLPIERVEPTPYQRNLSEPHVERLAKAIDKLGRFLDPVIAVRTDEGQYWTPNGHHRLAALRQLGARSIVALVVPEHGGGAPHPAAQHREGAQPARARFGGDSAGRGAGGAGRPPRAGVRGRVRRALAADAGLRATSKNGRFAGAAYHPVLKRTEKFLASKLSNALQTRREQAERSCSS